MSPLFVSACFVGRLVNWRCFFWPQTDCLTLLLRKKTSSIGFLFFTNGKSQHDLEFSMQFFRPALAEVAKEIVRKKSNDEGAEMFSPSVCLCVRVIFCFWGWASESKSDQEKFTVSFKALWRWRRSKVWVGNIIYIYQRLLNFMLKLSTPLQVVNIHKVKYELFHRLKGLLALRIANWNLVLKWPAFGRFLGQNILELRNSGALFFFFVLSWEFVGFSHEIPSRRSRTCGKCLSEIPCWRCGTYIFKRSIDFSGSCKRW